MIRSVAIKPKLSGIDLGGANKLKKYGELILDDDGLFRGPPGKYWSIDMRQMKRLEALGVCRIERVGESTFAVFIELR